MAHSSNEGGSCFHKMEILLQVSLLPSQTGHCMQAVKQKLNNMLFTYNESLQGIPLSYSDLEFPPGKEYGRIFADFPYVHVDVLTSMVVFKPTVGAQLTGRVVKVWGLPSYSNLILLLIFPIDD